MATRFATALFGLATLAAAALVNETGAVVREKIHVRRFVRFELGEGIQKEEADFASEVAAATKV